MPVSGLAKKPKPDPDRDLAASAEHPTPVEDWLDETGFNAEEMLNLLFADGRITVDDLNEVGHKALVEDPADGARRTFRTTRGHRRTRSGAESRVDSHIPPPP